MNWDPKSTKNFPPKEMACKCGCGVATMDHQFMMKLQKMRDALGFALPVTSGFRCKNHPEEMKKDKPGSHSVGHAADIRQPSARRRYEILIVALEVGMVGIGVSGGGIIHVDDFHPHMPRPAVWGYP